MNQRTKTSTQARKLKPPSTATKTAHWKKGPRANKQATSAREAGPESALDQEPSTGPAAAAAAVRPSERQRRLGLPFGAAVTSLRLRLPYLAVRQVAEV